MIGGCITRRWSDTLIVPHSVIDLISRQPELVAAFERLHQKHARRLPKYLGWGRTLMTTVQIDEHYVGTILTRCDPKRGLSSRAWADRVRRLP